MSQDPLHQSEGAREEWLRHAFEEWDAGEPSAAVWEEVDASLSVEFVWERVGQSLAAEEHLQDQWITDAHRSWEPQPETDGWDKLNDAISLEQVWRGLDHSLNRPVRTRIPIWKIAAACVASLFMAQQFSDMPVPQQTAYTSPSPSAGKPVLADSPVTQPSSSAIAQAQQDQTPVNGREVVIAHQRQIAVPGVRDERMQQLPVNQPEAIAEQQPVDQSVDNENVFLADLENKAVDPLTKRPWGLQPGQVYPTDFTHPSLPFNNWTVQVGTQLSLLQDRQQASLTSTLPHFGLAADVSMRHRVGPVQLIHALGVSQYAQGSAGWDNGRHVIKNQRITMMQLTTSLGYSHKRFTFYGGLLLSKMLTGVEEKDNKAVTEVYNFSEVQTGFTGGIDYRLKTFAKSGNSIAIGSQYQWLPSVNGGKKTSFENIQAIRIQAKFSF